VLKVLNSRVDRIHGAEGRRHPLSDIAYFDNMLIGDTDLREWA
jgi:hypothetical protein